MSDRQRAAEHIRENLCSFCATNVRRDDNDVLWVPTLFLGYLMIVATKEIKRCEVRNRYVEKALNLALVQIKRYDTINACSL